MKLPRQVAALSFWRFRRLFGLLACVGGLVLLLFVRLQKGNISIGFYPGLLPSAQSEYLTSSKSGFQRCTWHMGIGTRTWGTTYGVKFFRAYFSVGVTHTNPEVSPHDAGED
jgi:hypothetical protein